MEAYEGLKTKVKLSLESGNKEAVIAELSRLLPADRAELFSALSDEEQQEILPLLDLKSSADIFEELQGKEASDLAKTLTSENLALVLDRMSPDTAADILGGLSPEQATSALMQMDAPEEVANLLQYPDDTAGGLMTTEFISFNPEITAQQAIETLREQATNSNSPYYIYVVDNASNLLGIVGLRSLITAQPSFQIRDFMDTRVISVLVDTNQEEVAQVMKKYRLSLLPVVNHEGKLLGIIFADDIVFVLEDEATEDILRLANVADPYLSVWSSIGLSIRKRILWLFINLFTAFLAAGVVNIFEGTIAKLAILAVFQGIIAGQGGNAGTQTLALMVRGIAIGEVELRHTWSLLLRELLIGFINGVGIGIAVALAAWFWKGMPLLGALVGVSMIGNMVAAGIAGTLIPLGLKSLKMDPALASAVLVTTVTDCVGFGLFLWLATVFLPYLVN